MSCTRSGPPKSGTLTQLTATLRFFLRVVGITIITLCLSLSQNQTAYAHATLIRAHPADSAVVEQTPEEIRLWFDEEISTQFSSVRLFDANSQPFEPLTLRSDPAEPNLLIATLPPLADGVYSAIWKVLSESDGHFSQGILVFGVGEANTGAAVHTLDSQIAPPWPEVLLRWLNFGLLASLVGALAVVRLVLPAPTRVDTLSFTEAQRDVALARTAMIHSNIRWARWCAVLFFLAGFGLLYWQSIMLQRGLPDSGSFFEVSWRVVGDTRWGSLWLVRQLLALLLGSVLLWIQHISQTRPVHKTAAWVVAALLSIGLLGTQAMSSHASAIVPNTLLSVVVDLLHFLGAGLWVGGLVAFGVCLFSGRRQGRATIAATMQMVWKPFSALAVVSVGLLFATGLFSMSRQVASVDALLTTLYGRVLTGKILVVLGAGVLGLINSMLLHPHVAAPIAKIFGRPQGWTPVSKARFPLLVCSEAALGVLILFATSVITASSAPRTLEYLIAPEKVPTSLSQTVDDLVITLQVKPNRPGTNVFNIFTASSLRPPPAEVSRVILRFRYLEEESGLLSADAEAVEEGRYLLSGNYLSLAGLWEITLVVRRLGMDDSVARFEWLVAPAGEAQSVVLSKAPIQSPLTLASAGMLLLLLLVLVVLVWRTDK